MDQKQDFDRADDNVAGPTNFAERTDHAIRQTASTYLKGFGVNLDFDKIEGAIRDRPLRAAAIAAVTGFTLGGGMALRPAAAMLLLFGRQAAKQVAANFLAGMVGGNAALRSISGARI